MMIKRYRPAYFEGFENEIVSFSDNSDFNLKDVLEIPWIKIWSEDEDFHRYSQCDDKLMAEFDDGYKWYVIAMVNMPVFDLPIWKAKYYET